MKCDICESKDTYIKEHKHSYCIKDKKIEFVSNRRFCKNCNNLVYDEVLDNEASKKAIKIYNQNYGITGEQIIELRNKFNLSQQLFSKIIGCAKKTLISYEQDKSIPNDIYLITLRTLIDNPNILLNMIESNKTRFSEGEYKKIQDNIDIGNNFKQLLFKEATLPSIYNGFTKLSKEKIKNLILILCDKCMLKTKLLKEIFYIDFIAYKEIGNSMTGLEYVKLPFGPVPDDFNVIIQNLYNEKVVDLVVDYSEQYEKHTITSLIPFDEDVFSKEEMKIINRVKKYFKEYGSKAIAEYSHNEKAFIETEFGDKIDYEYAFDIENI